MLVWEIVSPSVVKPKKTAKPTDVRKNDKSDFEQNTSKLRSKQRDLKSQSPIPPIKHRP